MNGLYFKVKHIHIKLTNRATITSYYSKTIQFSPIFVVHDVLYVHEFSFNLISIYTLISNSTYILTFFG